MRMSTANFTVKCNPGANLYNIIAPKGYEQYSGYFTNLSALMTRIYAITSELRLKNVKAVFRFEY